MNHHVTSTAQDGFWNDRAASYSKDYDRAPMRAQATALLNNFVRTQNPRSILDLGCGPGIVSAALSRVAPSAVFTLVDSSAGMLDEARSRVRDPANSQFLQTSFADLSQIETSSVDIAVSSFALHHVEDTEKSQAMQELHRVLAANGSALIVDEIICDPAISSPEDVFSLMHRTFYPWMDIEALKVKFEDFVEYPTTLDAMVRITEDAGFSVKADIMNPIVASLRLTPLNKEISND